MRFHHYVLATSAAAVTLLVGLSTAAAAGPFAERWAQRRANETTWHGAYQNLGYGQPLAVVVPPTAHLRQTYSWGVSQNTNHSIHHQYGRNFPGYGYAPAAGFYHTPGWPSHTDQFGSYYVRGPW